MYKTILEELWDIQHRATDVLVDHFCDVIEDYGFQVTETENFDTVIYISFKLDAEIADLDGQLIINRIDRVFEIGCSLKFEDNPEASVIYAACRTNNFCEIENYLKLLYHDSIIYIEKVCIDTNNFVWYGLNFKTPI